MLEFRPPQIADREWVTHLMAYTSRENCEYCFGNIFNWSPVYQTDITRFGDFFLALSAGDDGAYCFLMGHGDLKAALNAIYPDRFAITEDRDFSDYIYLRQDLSTLPGKKYHAKRNHISAFVRENAYTYGRLTEKDLPDCAAMADRWIAQNLDKNPQALKGEQVALSRALEHFDALHLHGAALRIDGEMIAFTIGEVMSVNLPRGSCRRLRISTGRKTPATKACARQS